MNFLSMDYFLMTAEKRSFTKAADALHITQQTLSTHIANLEQELDCKLFVRHVPLELTYAGEIFWQYAADFQKKYRAMQHEFADLTKNEQGILRIGISFTRCHAIMPAIITEYQRRYPHMEIQVIENANTGLQKDLMEHKIDLAIAKFPDFLPGITLSDFYEEEVVLLLADSLFHEVISDAAPADSLFCPGSPCTDRFTAGTVNVKKPGRLLDLRTLPIPSKLRHRHRRSARKTLHHHGQFQTNRKDPVRQYGNASGALRRRKRRLHLPTEPCHELPLP